MTQARPNWRTRYENLLASSTKKAADQEDEFLRVEQELELAMAKISELSTALEMKHSEYHSMRMKAYSEERRANREALNHNRALRVMNKLMGEHDTDESN